MGITKLREKKNNNQGFTLLESLLVLFSTMIFITLPIIFVHQWKEQMEVEQFLSQLERRIQQTHQSALIELADTQITQSKDDQSFLFEYMHHGELHREYLDIAPNLYLRTESTIKFSAGSGNIMSIEGIKIEDSLNNRIIRYTFQLGSGKVIRRDQKV